MPDTPGSLMRRAAIAACLTLIVAARAFAAAAAGAAGTVARVPVALRLSPRGRTCWRSTTIRASRGTPTAAAISTWSTTSSGRASFLVDYQAVLGDEFRPFDPNQGNYTLEASASVPRSADRVAGVFHHVSRHLSDRPKRSPIAWNIARRARAAPHRGRPASRSTLRADVGASWQHSYVDYTWTGDLRPHRPPRRAARASAASRAGTASCSASTAAREPGHADRRPGRGGRAASTAAAARWSSSPAIERRVDADPLDSQAQRWAIAGFRLVSR